jgi:hypothetical protein
MGYQAKRKTFLLKFTDPEMEGLEVKVRSTSMGNILRMAELDNVNPLRMSKADIEMIKEVFAILESCIISWNLEEDGVPVPKTVDGFLSQDAEFIFTILKSWTKAMTAVEAPLGPQSQSGEQFPEDMTIPMESLSQSLVS